MTSQQDFLCLEAWKSSQLRTADLIVNMLPPDQQELQRSHYQLVRHIQPLSVPVQSSILDNPLFVQNDSPDVKSNPTHLLHSVSPILHVTDHALASPDHDSLQQQLTFLNKLQQHLLNKAMPQQHILRLSQIYINLLEVPNPIKSPSASAASKAKFTLLSANKQYALDQLALFKIKQPNLVIPSPTHYRVRCPNSDHFYCICKFCELIFTSRLINIHVRTSHPVQHTTNTSVSHNIDSDLNSDTR